MGSIPLPALSIKAPEQQDLLGQYGKAMQLRSLAAQQQMIPGQLQQQQQQIQAGGLENQQRQQALQDQQASTKALQQWDGKDVNEIPALILKNGGSANAVFGAKNQIVQQKEALTKLDSDTLANQAQKNDLLLGKLQSVTSGPDEGLGQRLAQTANEAVQGGLLDPQHAQSIQQLSQLPPDQLRQQLGIIEKGFMGQKEQFSQQQTQRENEIKQQNADADTTKANTEAAEFKAKLPGGPLADTGRSELQDWLSKNPGKGPADYEIAMKKIVPAYNFYLQNQGATGTANQPSAIAKGLADGSVKWNEVVSARTPMATKQALLSEVKGIKPDFNSGDATIERNVLNSAVSGPIGQNLTAFNTAIEHAKQLSSATDALGNGNIVALNKIGNALGYQFGSDKTTNFNVVKNAVSGEISKVFKGGGATDAEIEAVQGPFSAANSPAQLKGAINQAISLMNSKRDALKQQVDQGRQAKPNFGQEQSNASPTHTPGGQATGLTEGATGTGSDGKKYVVRGGIWQATQ